MSYAMSGASLLPEPETSLRWPLALLIAGAVELTLIFLVLGTHAKPVVASLPAPVKIARLVTIADVPGEPDPAPTAPPQKRESPKPAVKPLPQPSPKPQADAAPVESKPELQADSTQQEAPPAALPVVQRTQASTSAKADKPGAVRRGIVPLVRVEPDYPARALAANTEGVVVAHVTIEKDGSVSNVNIVRAQPPKIFDQEAIRALMRWKFSQNDGGTVGEVELHFTLN
ncbi:TonB family protein [Collimonas fungivorans]|uniref:Protein TonB n=1 Tax=Collimonas fungivorans (strain Ter331) TaxID=1005048 RepID=G0AEP3_COLFT|nr:TonB family protein [Collimonas fungivorans]AEK60178.1 Ferric siderophore transport system, periplasmic binding protein TonB [Collimonas fungivorans Ter331]